MAQSIQTAPINEEKMNEFLGKVVGDFGASLSSVLAFIGTKLGLYRALADSDGMTPAELASATGTNERYVREWLLNQASGGYVHYQPETGNYSLLPEQKTALTDESSPFYVGGGFYLVKALVNAQPRIADAFLDGSGIHWGDHDPDLFLGTEKFFRPGYTAYLVNNWIPSLTGVEEKLKNGGKVADVGCGHGASTIIMANAYPNAKFYAFDSHPASIAAARARAAEAGLSDRIEFAVATAQDFPDNQYDLITFLDCLHDMGDPAGAASRAYQNLAADGSVMIVEPMAGNTVEENFNPIGRTFSAASTLCCTANAIAQGGKGLGAVASEDALRKEVLSGGFTNFHRAAETPFNRVFEARK
ncbi:MAG: class I SAM-dependent methyltransferase [Acidobacteriota bacterium]